MSDDQMQDVFPISFDFKEGEMPTNEKLSGLVKFTDTAFSRITQAIGDPWDYQSHAPPLSLENLGQSSLARLTGPSDYLSPAGSCWNETAASVTVSLETSRNSWSLGYPLVKTAADIEEDSSVSGTITPLTWLTEISVANDTAGVLTTEQADIEDVKDQGDFHVDYYTGIITAYEVSTSTIQLTITNLHMFGAGVSWGSHNVIPSWKQTAVLCTIVKDTDVGDYSYYSLTLPTIGEMPRTGTSTIIGGTHPYDGIDPDATYSVTSSGAGANYRLPISLTSAFSTDEEIPGGYILLWDDVTSRIVPLVTFTYTDENTLGLRTSVDWLTVDNARYRIFVSGTSIAEAVNYLMQTTRDNRHIGLSEGAAGGQTTLHYTSPLSHDDFADLYSGDQTGATVPYSRWFFSKSNYPTNSHPQYLHRGGYLENDEDGNTGNAMRGDLVFSAVDDGTTLYTYTLDTDTSTYGIYFGTHSDTAWTAAAKFSFEGGDDTSWTSGIATKLGFGIAELGAVPYSPTGSNYGTVVFRSWEGMPLYLKGSDWGSDNDYDGAVLGFDLGFNNELNYIKLLPGIRDGSRDHINMPADVSQTGGLAFWITRGLDDHSLTTTTFSPEQIREFRFRGGAYVSGASNPTESLGNVADNQGTNGSNNEFDQYFTSPAIVGADFLNIYSNAIFFSDQGDGKQTSFTENGEAWLNMSFTSAATNRPSGIYYEPHHSSGNNANFAFSVMQGSTSYNPLSFGFSYGCILEVNGAIELTSNANDVQISADNDVQISAVTGMDFIASGSTSDINITCGRHLSITGDSDNSGQGTVKITSGAPAWNPSVTNNSIVVAADQSLYLGGDQGVQINSSSGYAFLTGNDGIELITGANNDIVLSAGYTSNYGMIWAQAIYENNLYGSGLDVSIDGSGLLGISGSSSIRVKENVFDMPSPDWLYDLRLVEFNYKKDEDKNKQYGLIAEELDEINKDFIRYDKKDIPEGINYKGFIPLLLKIVQDQKLRIDKLESKLTE